MLSNNRCSAGIVYYRFVTAAKIRIRIGRGKGNGEKVAKLLS